MNKETKYFDLVRDTYRDLTTLGTITCPDGSKFYTLEDCVRAEGIKDKGNTAIPANEFMNAYSMKVTFSQRFQRKMVMIFTDSDEVTLESRGISFKGIRIHGGNSAADVQGCIAVAKNRINDTRIQGTQEAVITGLVDKYTSEGYECRLRVRNLPQSE